jgi:two-component system, NtrC family, nitrogen regulation sensor histidine kinase NtrY
MTLRNFRLGIIFRVLLIAANTVSMVWLWSADQKIVAFGLMCLLFVYQLFEMFRFMDRTNRKLVRFLESIRYSDFTSGFVADNKAGRSFRELNLVLTEVMDAFRQARAEKEENWQYLHTVVQHINVGLLSFDSEGNLGLANQTARRFLNAPQLHNLKELQASQPQLYQAITDLQPGRNTLLRLGSDTELAMNATELKLRNKSYKIISIQNIQSELQQKEVEAWQNLSKVLRHEIMNSVTPIASLVGTLNDILNDDLVKTGDSYQMPDETAEDLREGLATIENRSKGLIKFVNTYRDFTNIPKPHFELTTARLILERVRTLMLPNIRHAGIALYSLEENQGLELSVDPELIEMVLINLIKNAMEALADREDATILLRSRESYDHHVLIEVVDNGPGIIPEAIERIFVPFFTTKAEGSGIGLSWSRQIMQLHKGVLSVQSEPGNTVFTLRF